MAPVYREAWIEVGLNGRLATADVRPRPFAGSSWWNLNLAILTRTYLRKRFHDLLHTSLALLSSPLLSLLSSNFIVENILWPVTSRCTETFFEQ